MTAFWIDDAYDRAHASNGRSRTVAGLVTTFTQTINPVITALDERSRPPLM